MSKALSLERKAAERSDEAARTARPHEQHRSLPATPAKNRGIGQATALRLNHAAQGSRTHASVRMTVA